VNIRAKAQTWEKAVRTKALARRDPYPPAKSAEPQRNTAITLYATGPNWESEGTPDEGNMLSTEDDARAATLLRNQWLGDRS
jgi:hypothetical protein